MNKITHLIALTILVTMMLFVPTTQASAALVRCRTDPIFVLSNGDAISVTLDIGTASTNVRKIHYILHLPAGVTVRRVAYTNLNFRFPESFQVYQDQSARTYMVKTLVATSDAGSIGVIVFGRLNAGIRTSVSGFNDQYLLMTLNMPQ